MNKRVLLMAGAAAGAVALLAAAIFAGVNVVNAATHGGRSFAMSLGRRVAPQQIQAQPDQPGAVVVFVEQGSPAELAGVSRGDVLLQIDSTPISRTADLSKFLNSVSPTATVSLKLTHGDTPKTVSATLVGRNGKAFLGVLVFDGQGMGRGFPGISPRTPFTSTHAMVTQVLTDSPAAGAGIVAGDTIISVDGKELAGDNTLASAISSHKAGDSVTLTIEHKGATTTADVSVKLAANPDTTKTGAFLGVQYVMGGPRGWKGFGPGPGIPMPFGRVSPQQRASGAVVRSVTSGSPADTAGLKQGDLIAAIDGTVVTSAQTLVADIATHKSGDEITLSVQHEGASTATNVKVTLGDNPSNKGTAYLGVSVSGGAFLPPRNRSQGTPGSNNPGLRRFFGNGQPGNGAQGVQNAQPIPGDTL